MMPAMKSGMKINTLSKIQKTKIIAIPIMKEITWLSVTALENIPIDAYTDPTKINPRYPVKTAP